MVKQLMAKIDNDGNGVIQLREYMYGPRPSRPRRHEHDLSAAARVFRGGGNGARQPRSRAQTGMAFPERPIAIRRGCSEESKSLLTLNV